MFFLWNTLYLAAGLKRIKLRLSLSEVLSASNSPLLGNLAFSWIWEPQKKLRGSDINEFGAIWFWLWIQKYSQSIFYSPFSVKILLGVPNFMNPSTHIQIILPSKKYQYLMNFTFLASLCCRIPHLIWFSCEKTSNSSQYSHSRFSIFHYWVWNNLLINGEYWLEWFIEKMKHVMKNMNETKIWLSYKPSRSKLSNTKFWHFNYLVLNMIEYIDFKI